MTILGRDTTQSSTTLVQTTAITTPITLATTTKTAQSCPHLRPGDIVLSRTTFLTALTLCAALTALSLGIASYLAYHAWARRRAKRAATRYAHRLSRIRREIDASYRSRHGGVLVHPPENPEMGSDSPVMIMDEERVWEVPAVPVVPDKHLAPMELENGEKEKVKRKTRMVSLFWDGSAGVWMPKR